MESPHMSLNVPGKESRLNSQNSQGHDIWIPSLFLLIPVNDPGQSMGWSQHMQASWQPVWPSAGPILVQLVTNDSELAAKYLWSPVIDPEAET